MRDWQALITWRENISIPAHVMMGADEVTYVEVLGVKFAMFGLVEVLFGDKHALAEEVLVDLLAVGLGNQPVSLSACMTVFTQQEIPHILSFV